MFSHNFPPLLSCFTGYDHRIQDIGFDAQPRRHVDPESSLILRTFAFGRHLYKLGIEPRNDLDQVGLRGHD